MGCRATRPRSRRRHRRSYSRARQVLVLDGPSYRTRHLPLDVSDSNDDHATEPDRISGKKRPKFPEPARRPGTSVRRHTRGRSCRSSRRSFADSCRRHRSTASRPHRSRRMLRSWSCRPLSSCSDRGNIVALECRRRRTRRSWRRRATSADIDPRSSWQMLDRTRSTYNRRNRPPVRRQSVPRTQRRAGRAREGAARCNVVASRLHDISVALRGFLSKPSPVPARIRAVTPRLPSSRNRVGPRPNSSDTGPVTELSSNCMAAAVAELGPRAAKELGRIAQQPYSRTEPRYPPRCGGIGVTFVVDAFGSYAPDMGLRRCFLLPRGGDEIHSPPPAGHAKKTPESHGHRVGGEQSPVSSLSYVAKLVGGEGTGRTRGRR